MTDRKRQNLATTSKLPFAGMYAIVNMNAQVLPSVKLSGRLLLVQLLPSNAPFNDWDGLFCWLSITHVGITAAVAPGQRLGRCFQCQFLHQCNKACQCRISIKRLEVLQGHSLGFALLSEMLAKLMQNCCSLKSVDIIKSNDSFHP